MNLPTPSAWREELTRADEAYKIYSYAHKKPEDADNCVPMFTQGQLARYGQACFEEGCEAASSPTKPLHVFCQNCAYPQGPTCPGEPA